MSARPTGRMRCQRCGGRLVFDQLVDLSDDTGMVWCDAWRCMNCGMIVDEVILRNREQPPQSPLRSNRRWRTPLSVASEGDAD